MGTNTVLDLLNEYFRETGKRGRYQSGRFTTAYLQWVNQKHNLGVIIPDRLMCFTREGA